jgi:hypothetical protein
VNAVVCSKKKNVTKNARKKTKKDLTGPTLLEISEYPNKSGVDRPEPGAYPATGYEVWMDSLEKSLDWLFSEEPRSGLSA